MLKFTGQSSKIAFGATRWGELGVTYMAHVWLVGKRVVNFFRQHSPLRRYEQTLVEIVFFKRDVGHFKRNFRVEGVVVSTNNFRRHKN